jgi:hypothetical protein
MRLLAAGNRSAAMGPAMALKPVKPAPRTAASAHRRVVKLIKNAIMGYTATEKKPVLTVTASLVSLLIALTG